MNTTPPAPRPTHVCPWWLIHTFDNPLRRLVQSPERILAGLVRPGDDCVDVGCGIGYFTIPMARLAGPTGSVTAVDLQPEMLAGVEKRARQAGLLDRIRLHQADASGLHLATTFDFGLAFWMAHEVPDRLSLFSQIRLVLKPGGRLLLVEPLGHVGREAFANTVAIAEQAGLVEAGRPRVSLSRAVVLTFA